MKEEIIYITPISMPSSSAASKRILGNAKMFNYYGYKTVVFSGKNFRSQKYNYEGIDVFASGIGIEDSKGLKKFLAYRKTVLHLLKKLNQLNVDKIKCIIVYGGYSMYIYFLYKWAKKNKVNICFDAVEWYSPKSKFEWLFNPYYWDIEISMRILLPKLNGVVCISSFLKIYYESKNCNTFLIPPLFTKKYSLITDKQIKPLRVSYSGSPGKKDELDKIFRALSKINAKKIKIIFDIIGLNEDQILDYSYFKYNKIYNLPSYIKAFGFLDRPIAERITANSNFSILFRKKTKTNNAGFSTKLVESLSLGVPLICNITSDMGDYLKNNENAIVTDTLSLDNITKALVRATKLSFNKINIMSQNAYQTAQENFYFKNFNLDKTKF